MQIATARLGVSRQTVLEWIKRGKLDAVTIRQGRLISNTEARLEWNRYG